VRVIRSPFRPCGAALVVALCAPFLSLIPSPAFASGADRKAVARPDGRRVASSSHAPSGRASPTGVLSLGDARAAALRSSPRLAGLAAQMSARRALELQAGLYPNPEVALELENVGGTGDRTGFEETETTLWISQLVPLGGKIGERQRVAALEGDLAQRSLEATRREVVADTTNAFVATLAAQERLALSNDLTRLASAALRAVTDQVRAGAASSVEQTRARIAEAEAELERTSAERDLAVSRAALAATWGADAPGFREVRGDLDDLTPPPPLDRLQQYLADGPEAARWDTELAQREAALALERARRVPDPTFRLGARHFHDNDDDALVFEVAVPIPVFDRNQGNVLAADHELARARADREGARALAAAALAERYQELVRAYEEAIAVRQRLLPDAEAAFAGVRDGYRAGRFGQLDLLQAQRTLFEVRRRRLEALAAYHRAAADLERLTGEPLAIAAGNRGGVR